MVSRQLFDHEGRTQVASSDRRLLVTVRVRGAVKRLKASPAPPVLTATRLTHLMAVSHINGIHVRFFEVLMASVRVCDVEEPQSEKMCSKL